jgi:hypothetical protein
LPELPRRSAEEDSPLPRKGEGLGVRVDEEDEVMGNAPFSLGREKGRG